MVAEPVGAVGRLRAIDTDHQVAVSQDLVRRHRRGEDGTGTRTRTLPVLTFLTVATQMADRFRGSMASSFIPSWNQEPLWSTSFTCTGTHSVKLSRGHGGGLQTPL